MATFRDFLSTFSVFLAISRKNLILEGFGGALGRVWGGFWEGFGRVCEPLGRCWELPWLFCFVFRDFLRFWRRFLFFVVFSFSSCKRATAQDTVCLAREPRLTLFGITLSVPRTWSRNAFIAAVSTFLHQQASCLLPFTPSHMSKEGRRYVRSTRN